MFKLFKKNRLVKDITKEEMQDFIMKERSTILLDVRSIQEFKEGHIPGAINIPYYELERDSEKILKDKNNIIIVYCNVGARSRKAIKILDKKGYTNLYNVKYGIGNI